MAQLPLVSLVTLNYNGIKFLGNFFDSLKRCTYPNLEIIMVDNCSTDDSVSFVTANYPDVKIHQNKENLLYAGGNNQGLKIAKGEFICLLNNDVEVHPGFVEPIVEAFLKNNRIGAAQPKLLDLKQRDYLEYAGACGGFLDHWGYPFLRGRILMSIEKDTGQHDQPIPIFWASGACIFLRKSALNDSGLLDPDFGLHMEEIDLCWRLLLTNWQVWAIPSSKIWHYGGGTLPQNNPKKVYWNFRNNILMLIKNRSLKNLVFRMPIRFVLDGVAMLRDLLIGNFANAFSVIKAYGWLITHIPLMLKKRRQVQAKRKVSEKHIEQWMYPGSIIWEYFVLKHQQFSELKNHLHLLPNQASKKKQKFVKKQKQPM